MKSVLVVDDSLISRRMIKQMLGAFNVSIDEAKNGTEAIEKVQTNHYDLILLDLLMPDIQGQEVLEFIQKSGINTNVVVISADIQETTKARCKELGAKAFLNKPPKEEEFHYVVKEFLE